MYDELKKVYKKANGLLNQLCDNKVCDATLLSSILMARSIEEIEEIQTIVNKDKKTNSQKIKEKGLDELIEKLFLGQTCFIAKEFDKNTLMTEAFMNKLLTSSLQKISSIIPFDKVKLNSVAKKERQSSKKIVNDKFKFETLAMLRGEAQKVLNLRLEPLEWCKDKAYKEFEIAYTRSIVSQGPGSNELLRQLLHQSFNNKIIPKSFGATSLLKLKHGAQEVGLEVFAQNLRNILLVPPLKGVPILGVDPGYSHGCKMALVSPLGHLLATDVMHLDRCNNSNGQNLVALLSTHKCYTIALGNGKGRQEFESFLAQHVISPKKGFAPDIKNCGFDVSQLRYYIVDERGSSHYSVANVDREKEQLTEPEKGLDPKMRSAASIARRLQDPLNELVKVDPKNLGIGMYQHDLPKCQLEKALNGIVEECVSFVGVDLNTCSPYLLSRVAGLNMARAKAILEHRKKSGEFVNRTQLRSIKGIGEKSFEQCAGFVKILPSTMKDREESGLPTSEPPPAKRLKVPSLKRNPLDSTIIHPDSYALAEKFLEIVDFPLGYVGSKQHASALSTKINGYLDANNLSLNDSFSDMMVYDSLAVRVFGVDGCTVKLVIDGLKKSTDQYYDYRQENSKSKPIARCSVLKPSDIVPGLKVSGTVSNVTDFGYFIDCALPHAVFVHTSHQTGPFSKLKTGDSTLVEILKYDTQKRQISGRPI